jgi:hypothetical protein
VLTLNVPEDELEGQVANNKFTQQEAFPLPEELSRQLGAPEPLIIPAGHYPARLVEGRYIISFSTQE